MRLLLKYFVMEHGWALTLDDVPIQIDGEALVFPDRAGALDAVSRHGLVLSKAKGS